MNFIQRYAKAKYPMVTQHDLSKYPEGTLLSLLVIDIYADYDDVTILYDRPFLRELIELELDTKTAELTFIFDGGKVPYGEPIMEDILETMETVETVTLIQMDMGTRQAITGMEIPLKLI